MDWIEPIIKTWVHIAVGLAVLWGAALFVGCMADLVRELIDDMRGR